MWVLQDVFNQTFFQSNNWQVSSNKEVANLVNAINALNGHLDLINATDKSEIVTVLLAKEAS